MCKQFDSVYFIIESKISPQRSSNVAPSIVSTKVHRLFSSRRFEQMWSARNSRFLPCNHIHGARTKRRAATMGCRYDISYICQFIKVLLMDYNGGVVRVVRNRRESSWLEEESEGKRVGCHGTRGPSYFLTQLPRYILANKIYEDRWSITLDSWTEKSCSIFKDKEVYRIL